MPLPSGRGRGLSRGGRSGSYGSLIRSPLTSVHRLIEHTVQPGETLQGLAVKYGVSVSIYIKKCDYSYVPIDFVAIVVSLYSKLKETHCKV